MNAAAPANPGPAGPVANADIDVIDTTTKAQLYTPGDNTDASGFVDVVTESCLKIYDFMALVPVIEGAGGIMTDWSGAPLDRHSDGHVLAAANETCHREAMAYLKNA